MAWPDAAASVCSTRLLTAADGGQMMEGSEHSALFLYFPLCSSSCVIVSSPVHTGQKRVCLLLLFSVWLFCCCFFFFVPHTRTKPGFGAGDVFLGGEKWDSGKTEGCSRQALSSFWRCEHCHLFVVFVLFCFFQNLVFVRAHIGRQVFSRMCHEPWTLLYIWTWK